MCEEGRERVSERICVRKGEEERDSERICVRKRERICVRKGERERERTLNKTRKKWKKMFHRLSFVDNRSSLNVEGSLFQKF
jgi:hypothetical protein